MLTAHHVNAFLLIAVCALASAAAFWARRTRAGHARRAAARARADAARRAGRARPAAPLRPPSRARPPALRLRDVRAAAVLSPWLYAPTEPRARLLWFAVATLARRGARSASMDDGMSPFVREPVDSRGRRARDRGAQPGDGARDRAACCCASRSSSRSRSSRTSTGATSAGARSRPGRREPRACSTRGRAAGRRHRLVDARRSRGRNLLAALFVAASVHLRGLSARGATRARTCDRSRADGVTCRALQRGRAHRRLGADAAAASPTTLSCASRTCRPARSTGSTRSGMPTASSRRTTRSSCSGSRTTSSDNRVTAAFAWARGGTGRLVLEHERGAITRLVVIFDE